MSASYFVLMEQRWSYSFQLTCTRSDVAFADIHVFIDAGSVSQLNYCSCLSQVVRFTVRTLSVRWCSESSAVCAHCWRRLLPYEVERFWFLTATLRLSYWWIYENLSVYYKLWVQVLERISKTNSQNIFEPGIC